MENLEQKEAQLLEKIKTQVGDQLKEVSGIVNELKSKNTSLEAKYAELEQKAASMKSADPEQMKLISDEVTRIAGELKAAQETRTNQKVATIEETLKSHEGQFKEMLARKSGTVKLELKATQTSADIGSGDSWDTLGRDHLSGWHKGGAISEIPTRKPFMNELFQKLPTSDEYVKYMEQDTIVRDAKNVAGCAASTHNTKITFKKRTIQMEKVRDFVHICDDMLTNYPFVKGQITRLIKSSIDLKIDNDLVFGTGVSPIIRGLDYYASTFNASASGASYANTVVNADIVDLLSVAGAQIKAFGQQNAYNPDTIAMNPRDLQLLKMIKNLDGDSITKNGVARLFYQLGGNFYIDGMLVVENPLIPEDQAYVFDSSKGYIYYIPGVGIEFSYENGTNFETETVTVKAYRRMNFLVENNNANAFMHIGSLAQGVADIKKV